MSNSYSRIKKMIDAKSKQRARRKKLFIETYKKNFGNATLSCRQMNISIRTYYSWRKTDLDFNAAIEDYNNDI